jgi:hypothetical protein
LINALIDDLGGVFMSYQNITNKTFGEYFWYTATPNPEQFNLQNTCSWKLHLIADSVTDTLPPVTQIVPDLRVTDPGGKVYTLEEVSPIMDEYFTTHITERQEDYLYQSGEETDEQFFTRQEHLKQWEDEFKRRDEVLVLKDKLAALEVINRMEAEIDFEGDNTRGETPRPFEDITQRHAH